MIQKAIFFLVITALVAFPAFSLPHDGVNGDWDATMHIVGYTVTGSMTFKADGETLTGSCFTEHTGKGTITGTVKDDNVTFTAKFEKHEDIDFTGTFKDGKLDGEFKTEGNTGQWSAVPHKSS